MNAVAAWHFCALCGTALVQPADAQLNPICPRCHWFRPTYALPVVLVLAHAPDGRIVFTRKNDWLAGAWALVAGFIEVGETAEAAAIREVAEETGLIGTAPRIRRTLARADQLLIYVEVAVEGEPKAGSDVDAVLLADPDPGRVPKEWLAHELVDEFRQRTQAPGSLPTVDSITRNVEQWTKNNREALDARAGAAWARNEPTWGIFGIPEADLGSPLGDVRGLDVIELGCGTAYFSAILAKLGARPVGVDPTPAQLATARRMQDETGIRFPLVEAPGERVPLPDASFDLAFSEYGASLWADPKKWVPESARLLRPGGRLVFLTNSTIAMLCSPDEGDVVEQLMRPLKGMYRTEWPDEIGVEYHLAHGDWIDLRHGAGLEIERLIDVYAGPDSKKHDYYGYVSPEWGRKWPAEEIWTARKRT